MNQSVYIETSVVSYLIARPNRDIIIAKDISKLLMIGGNTVKQSLIYMLHNLF